MADNSVDLIIGGPPCQAYSIVGRSREDETLRLDAIDLAKEYFSGE